jgi:hypothetical protein
VLLKSDPMHGPAAMRRRLGARANEGTINNRRRLFRSSTQQRAGAKADIRVAVAMGPQTQMVDFTPAQTSAGAGERGRDLSSLQFRVLPFAEEHLPLVRAFSERYWNRPRTDSFYRWRYVESLPFSRMFLALTDAECLGMVFAFRKIYMVGGQPTPCNEVFDWHSLPGLSGTGVGIRVMRAMMKTGEQLLGIGGTAEVLKVLPAMRWQTVSAAYSYELPLSSEALVDGLRRRVSIRVPGERLLLKALVAAWFRRVGHRKLGTAIPVATLGPEVDALYVGETGYGMVQRPHPEWLRWLTSGYPGAGSFRFWYFRVHGQLRGWALTRLYETEQGREASILDVYAQKPTGELYAWMLSEVVASLLGEAPMLIRARASCPILRSALRSIRFREGDPVPVFASPAIAIDANALHLTLNHTDAGLRPYPPAGMID